MRNPELWGFKQMTSATNVNEKSEAGLYFPFFIMQNFAHLHGSLHKRKRKDNIAAEVY